jgi:hypothetical protein
MPDAMSGRGEPGTSGPRRRGRRGRRLGVAVTVSVLAALLAAGCGLGAGKAPKAVGLLVTREFGAKLVRSTGTPEVRGQETVMSLLTRNARVSTRYGGGFVQSIDGLAGGAAGGQPVDWFYYVNGVEASKGAAATNVNPGDRIWWDWHDWSETDDVPAVVGSFPQPFLNGLGGKRLPVRVECQNAEGQACRTVVARLRAQGVPAAIAGLGSGFEATQTLRVAVAPWRVLGADPTVHAIGGGPRASGVYARFSTDASKLTLLDAKGGSAQVLGAGSGLIAATRTNEDAPIWVVTGTDTVGMQRAAQAFDTATLKDRFAVAVGPSGALALPRPGA